MTYSTFPVPVRCSLCGFSSAHVYAVMNHNCDEYIVDPQKCIAFPLCNHTADQCADNDLATRIDVSYHGYTFTLDAAWDSDLDEYRYSATANLSDDAKGRGLPPIAFVARGYDNGADAIRKMQSIADIAVRVLDLY